MTDDSPPRSPAVSLADAGSPLVIDARDLSRTFDDQVAVDGVTLQVRPGSILGLIGPSGCGKTTLVRMLTGIIRPTSGEVRVFGHDPAELTTEQRLRSGYMPQLPVLFPSLSLWSNLIFISSLYGGRLRGRRARLMELLELVDLVPHRHKQFADTSGGMQRRLALAATLVHDPDLLYLDEPTAGVDPILRERFWTHFRTLRDAGKTLVVSTQYVGEAVSCDLVAVMAAGRIIMLEPPAELRRRAYGGDPMEVSLDRGWMSGAEIRRLESQPFVRSVRRTDAGLEVTVGDAETDTTALDRYFAEAGIESGPITQLEPSYDDMFVRIINAHNDALVSAA